MEKEGLRRSHEEIRVGSETLEEEKGYLASEIQRLKTELQKKSGF